MTYVFLTWVFWPILYIRTLFRRGGKRILVVQTAKIGDFVSTSNVFVLLKEYYPDCELNVLVHPSCAPIAKAMGCINRVYQLGDDGYKGIKRKIWLYKLMSRGFNSVLILSPNVATVCAAVWAGIPKRVSVLPDRRARILRLAYFFLTHKEQHKQGQRFQITALKSLYFFGIDFDKKKPKNNYFPTNSSAAVQKKLFPNFSRGGILIGIGIGAGNQLKSLSLMQLVKLCQGIFIRLSCTLVLIGTRDDSQTAAEIVRFFPNTKIIDLTGKIALNELGDLFSCLDCFVGVDSGATYIADAVGVPVVDFMGPANSDDQRPIGSKAVVIRSSEKCAPCSFTFEAPYTCYLGTRSCVENAPIESMIDEVERLVNGKSL